MPHLLQRSSQFTGRWTGSRWTGLRAVRSNLTCLRRTGWTLTLALPLILPIADATTLSAPSMAQTIYRDRVESNWDDSTDRHRSSGWIRRGTIEDSTLVQPVIIDSEIEDSTLINPVIVEPRSTRSRRGFSNYGDRLDRPGMGGSAIVYIVPIDPCLRLLAIPPV